MSPPTYRANLRAVVAASTAPYGYTLTIWTSGAFTTHVRGGMPSALDAVLLLCEAVAGYVVVGTVAYGDSHASLAAGPPQQVRMWAGALSLLRG